MILGLFRYSIRFRAYGLIWGENLKNWQNIPKLQNIQNLCHPTLTAYICGKIAPHPYVSYIFRNVWISSFTLSSLNLYYVVKITHKLRFKKKYRFVQISTILGLIPIVNVVISRFCALWFNFLYDFIYNVPNMHEFIVKMPFSDLKYHFWFGPPSGLNLDLNLTPPHILTRGLSLERSWNLTFDLDIE